jgi:hypothetical protein
MKTHKFIIAVLFSLILFGPLMAQEETEPQYLLNLKNVKLSGFGGTLTEFSITDGDFAVSTGAGGAFLFNYSFYIGVYGLNLTTNHFRADIYPSDHNPISNPKLPLYNDLQLSFENSGIWLGYINSHKKLVHWGANLKIGQGTIGLQDKDFKNDDSDYYFKDKVFVASPEIECELNLTRWFKINMGVGYRFVAGVDDKTFTNSNGDLVTFYKSSQFNSPIVNVKLLFGRFEPKKKAPKNTDN